MDAMEEMPEMPMNGFTKTISQTKHAHLIKLKDMTMVWDVQLKSNAKTVCQVRDAGLKKEQRSMELINSTIWKVKKI